MSPQPRSNSVHPSSSASLAASAALGELEVAAPASAAPLPLPASPAPSAVSAPSVADNNSAPRLGGSLPSSPKRQKSVQFAELGIGGKFPANMPPLVTEHAQSSSLRRSQSAFPSSSDTSITTLQRALTANSSSQFSDESDSTPTSRIDRVRTAERSQSFPMSLAERVFSMLRRENGTGGSFSAAKLSREGRRGYDVTSSKEGFGVDQAAVKFQLERKKSGDDGSDSKGAGAPIPIAALNDDQGDSAWFPLDPRSNMMVRWTFVTSMLLVYTALVTPYEVAFITEPATSEDVSTADLVLWWINLVLDCCFMLDVLLNFITAYYDPVKDVWVARWDAVISHYVRGWFLVDIVSGVPVGLVKGPPGTEVPEAIAQLGIVKLVKLLRLAKLLRMLRAGRNLQKLESVVEINYDILRLAKFLVGLLVYVHWETCLCRYVVGESWQATHNWINRLQDTVEHVLTNDEIYIAAIHLTWTGNLIPEMAEERWVVMFTVVMHTSVLAFLIGEVSNIVENLNAESSKFNRFMQNLNAFMREKMLSTELRRRLREFYRYHFNTENSNSSSERQESLLKELSPMLRNEVAFEMNQEWVGHVHLFRNLEQDFIVELTLRMITETYAPQEIIFSATDLADKIFVVQRGVVSVRGRICCKGSVFGERAFLSNDHPRGYMAVTLTYSCLSTVSADVLHKLLKRFPKSAKKLRKFIIKQLISNVFVQYAAAIKRREIMANDPVAKDRPYLSRTFTLGGTRNSQSFFDFAAWLATTQNRDYYDKMATRIQSCWRTHILRNAGTTKHPKGELYASLLRSTGSSKGKKRKSQTSSNQHFQKEQVPKDMARAVDDVTVDSKSEVMARLDRLSSHVDEQGEALRRIEAYLAQLSGSSKVHHPTSEEARSTDSPPGPPEDEGDHSQAE